MEEKGREEGFAVSGELWKRREERKVLHYQLNCGREEKRGRCMEGISKLERKNRSNYIVGNSETLLTLEVTILAIEIHTSITLPPGILLPSGVCLCC